MPGAPCGRPIFTRPYKQNRSIKTQSQKKANIESLQELVFGVHWGRPVATRPCKQNQEPVRRTTQTTIFCTIPNIDANCRLQTHKAQTARTQTLLQTSAWRFLWQAYPHMTAKTRKACQVNNANSKHRCRHHFGKRTNSNKKL